MAEDAPTNQPAEMPTNQPAADKPPKQKRKWNLKTIIITAIVVPVVLIGILVAFVFFSTQGAVNVSNDFLDHLNNGEFSEAFELTSDEFREFTDRDQLEIFATERQGLFDDVSQTGREISTGDDDGSASTISYEGSLEGQDYDIEVLLNKIDGDWKVRAVNVE